MAYTVSYSPTLRQVKGTELTWTETDSNFSSLTTELSNIALELTSASTVVAGLDTRIGVLETNQINIPDGTVDDQRLVWSAGTNTWVAQTISAPMSREDTFNDAVYAGTSLAFENRHWSGVSTQTGDVPGNIDMTTVGETAITGTGNGTIFKMSMTVGGSTDRTYNISFTGGSWVGEGSAVDGIFSLTAGSTLTLRGWIPAGGTVTQSFPTWSEIYCSGIVVNT